VCISWKLKCWILLMHGVTMKSQPWSWSPFVFELSSRINVFMSAKKTEWCSWWYLIVIFVFGLYPWQLCLYEGCPERIQPFWISREPVAWPWCNFAASKRRPYCAPVNCHSPVGLVSRRWDTIASLCTVWPSHSQ